MIDVQPADRPSFALTDGALKLGLNPFKYSVFVHVLGELYIIIVISVLSNRGSHRSKYYIFKYLQLQVFAMQSLNIYLYREELFFHLSVICKVVYHTLYYIYVYIISNFRNRTLCC